MMLPERSKAAVKANMTDRPTRDNDVQSDGSNGPADGVVIRQIIQI